MEKINVDALVLKEKLAFIMEMQIYLLEKELKIKQKLKEQSVK